MYLLFATLFFLVISSTQGTTLNETKESTVSEDIPLFETLKNHTKKSQDLHIPKFNELFFSDKSDSIDISIRNLKNEQKLKLAESSQGTIVQGDYQNHKAGLCSSIVFLDYIDVELETEPRHLRLTFIELDDQSLSAIGLETTDDQEQSGEAELARIFFTSTGNSGYCDALDYEYENNIKIRNALVKEEKNSFSYRSGDQVQVAYLPETKMFYIFNSSTNNMVLFNEETLKKLGKSFRIFVCIANPSSSILLSG